MCEEQPRRAADDPGRGSPAEPVTAGRRRLGTLALVVLAFVAGSVASGAGAVWASHQFPDVPTSSSFHDDIDWLVDQEITTGYADGTFKPTAPVSRQAMAAFLHRYSDRVQLVQGPVVDPVSATSFVASVDCPVGTRVIGGNALTLDSGIALTSASPTIDRKFVARWESRTGSPVNPSGLQVSAICVPA